MRLGAEVVDLVRADIGQQTDQVRGIGEVTVVEVEAFVIDLWVLVEVVDPVGVEVRGAALDPVDLVALLEQELREVRTVLAGYTCD